MAAIHPSRMGLIQPSLREPLNRNDYGTRREYSRDRTRSRSPPRRSSRSPPERRQSPDYGEYRRTNMYPERGRTNNPGDWLENRRVQRENATANVWPPSPKGPVRELSPQGRRRSKRARSSSSSSSSSSEDERRRRKRKKEKKRSKKEHRRHGRSLSRSPARRYHDSEDDYEKRRSRKTRSRSRSSYPLPTDEREEWIEKPSASSHANTHSHSHSYSHHPHPPRSPSADDDDDDLGPKPAVPIKARKIDERSYGSSLLRGEGSAMAAFLQGESGTDARIPRRGEIGLTSEQIAKYEEAGYVMSGSRHHRMNAVRMRKENQVISAEEKRSMLKLQKEEKERREAILREEFSELVSENLKKGVKSEKESGEKK